MSSSYLCIISSIIEIYFTNFLQMKSWIQVFILPTQQRRCSKLISQVLPCSLDRFLLQFSVMKSVYLQLFLSITFLIYLMIDCQLIQIPIQSAISHIYLICAQNYLREDVLGLLDVHQLLALERKSEENQLEQCFLFRLRLPFRLFFIVKFFILQIKHINKENNNTKIKQFTNDIVFQYSSKVKLQQQFLMSKYFLLFFLLTLSHTAAIVIGGFTELKDKQQITKVGDFIKLQIPLLEKWNIESINYQIVNGANYRAILTDKGNTAQIIVYSTFGGKMKITSYILNSQTQSIPQYTQKDSNNQTATTSNNNKTVCDVYQQLNPLNSQTRNSIIFTGGYQSIPLNSTQNSQVWNQIVKVFPQLQNYTILSIRSQVVAGMNYIFITQSQGKDREIVLRVFRSLSHNYTVSIIHTNTAVGVTLSQIIAFHKKCIELKPDLSNYQLTSISNAESGGVKLVYSTDGNNITANCSNNGDSLKVVFA